METVMFESSPFVGNHKFQEIHRKFSCWHCTIYLNISVETVKSLIDLDKINDTEFNLDNTQ